MDDRTLLKRRNSLILLLLILCFCEGWLSVYSLQQFTLVLVFAPSIVMTGLIITISQLKNRPIIQSYQWLIIISWPISVPIYLLRFYKWKGLGVLLLGLPAGLLFVNLGYYLALFTAQ